MWEEGDVRVSTELEEHRQYIASLDLSGIRRPIVEQDAETEAGEIFAKGKDQALVVGSGVFSFATGVDEEVRQAISAVPIGAARRMTEGSEVTIVAWGNTVEKSMEAVALSGMELTLVPP